MVTDSISIERVEHALKYNGTIKIQGKVYHAYGMEFYTREDAENAAKYFRKNGYNARVYLGNSWGRYRVGVARRKRLATRRK